MRFQLLDLWMENSQNSHIRCYWLIFYFGGSCSNHKVAQLTFPLRVRLGDDPIKRVKAAKSFGVHIDEHLSWSNHIEHIAKKISSGIAGLKLVRPFVPKEALIKIFKSLVLPYFDVWSGLNKTDKGLSDRFDKLYNRAARINTQSDWEIRSADILRMLQWDTLGVRRQHHNAIIMHKIMHNKAPEYLTEVFNLIRDSTAYHLRDCSYNIWHCRNPKLKAWKRGFHIVVLNYGILFQMQWKQNSRSLKSFRKSLHTFSLHNSN